MVGWILISPVIGTVWFPSQSVGAQEIPIAIALACILVMMILDSAMNGGIILPYLLVAGALSPRWLSDFPAQKKNERLSSAVK